MGTRQDCSEGPRNLAKDIPSEPLPFLGSLALSPRAEDRGLWLRIAIDYFLSDERADASRREEFLTKFFDCLASVDDAGRLAVARKLFSPEERAPPELVAGFTALGGEAEIYVLAHARTVPRDSMLIAAADSRRAAAVARRGDLDAETVATILAGGAPDALAALVANTLAPLSAAHILDLAHRARSEIETSADRRLAELLLSRAPARAEYAPLFLEAAPAQRTAILIAAQRSELGQPRALTSANAPREAIELLERTALAGESELFAKALAQTLGCSLELAQRIAGDRTGEPLAVALAAIGAANDVSVRILTSSDLREGADYPRVRALARLQDVLNPAAARRVLVAMIGEAQTRGQSDAAARGIAARQRAPGAHLARRAARGKPQPRRAPPAPRARLSRGPSGRKALAADKGERRRREIAEPHQYRADQPEGARGPGENADPGDDRRRSEHDGDLQRAARVFEMLEPAVGEFAPLLRLARAFLNLLEAVLGLLRVVFELGDGRLPGRDLLLDRRARLFVGDGRRDRLERFALRFRRWSSAPSWPDRS